jgi:hypothetical protein
MTLRFAERRYIFSNHHCQVERQRLTEDTLIYSGLGHHLSKENICELSCQLNVLRNYTVDIWPVGLERDKHVGRMHAVLIRDLLYDRVGQQRRVLRP